MSSGDSELPPTYYFSGITFNPSFYTSDYITNATGKKYFLSYPIAQGTETISTLKTSTIDTATAGTMTIGASITNGITVGSATAATTVAGALTVSGVTTINGTLTANNGLTLGNGYGITCGSTGYTPTASQVGYIQSVAYPTPAPTLPTSTQIRTMASITLDPGTWILTGAVSIGGTQNVTHAYISFGDTSRPASVAPVIANDSAYGNTSFMGVTLSNIVTPNLTVYVSPTGTTTYYFNISATYTGTPGFNSSYWKLYAIRIA